MIKNRQVELKKADYSKKVFKKSKMPIAIFKKVCYNR